MCNSRRTLIELSGNQRFVLAYVPTGSLYDVNEGDEVTIKTGLQTKRGIITRAESFAAALPREFARSWVPIRPPLVWSSPQIRGTGQRAHPARDVLHRCYTGYSLLCQGEMLSKF
jgi:hypothetical protein